MRYTNNIPTANVLVKEVGSIEHTVHISHITHIPTANVLVKGSGRSEELAEFRRQTQVRAICGIALQVGATSKGTIHCAPLGGAPLLYTPNFVATTCVIKENTIVSTTYNYGISACRGIGMAWVIAQTCFYCTIAPINAHTGATYRC